MPLRCATQPLFRAAAASQRRLPSCALALPRCPAPTRQLSLNVFKEGEEPKIMADEEYPEWLKQLAYPALTLEELENMDIWEMDDRQRKRYWKLHKKKKLRQRNELARVSSV